MFGQNNFQIWWSPRDKFSTETKTTPRIGDSGKVSEDYVNRAYSQWKQNNWHDLAKVQDSFEHPDPIEGTPGREKNRNYKRMEYDLPELVRVDGKGQDEVINEVYRKQDIKVKDLLDAFKQHGYTLNNTASSFGWKPIEGKDYEGQMTH